MSTNDSQEPRAYRVEILDSYGRPTSDSPDILVVRNPESDLFRYAYLRNDEGYEFEMSQDQYTALLTGEIVELESAFPDAIFHVRRLEG